MTTELTVNIEQVAEIQESIEATDQFAKPPSRISRV
jgi:hypothetical protein